jgi:hypothetical protein
MIITRRAILRKGTKLDAEALRKSETLIPPHAMVKRLNRPPAKKVMMKNPAVPASTVPADAAAKRAPNGLPISPASPRSNPSLSLVTAILLPKMPLRKDLRGNPTASARTSMVTHTTSISLYDETAAAAPLASDLKKRISGEIKV